MGGSSNTVAKKQNGRLLNFLSSMVGGTTPPKTIAKTTLNTDEQTSISPAESSELIKRVSQSTGMLASRRGIDSYGKYIKPLTQQIAQTKLDNEAIRILAPEIRTAENLVIPSIMSPTDLKDGDIKITSTSKMIDELQNNRISEILDKHFNKTLNMSAKLPEWIREALYGAGSKPLLVLPITELDIIMNDPTAIASKSTSYGYSSESLAAAAKTSVNLDIVGQKSIFGISDNFHTKKTLDANKLSELRPAIESAISNFIFESGGVSKTKDKTDASYNLEAKFSKDRGYSELTSFANEAIENLSIIDDPDILKVDKAKKSKKKSEITENIVIHYKSKSVITLNPENKASVGNPVVYELPPESVIPIFTPGTPTDHIGYFVCLDNFGNPIHLDDNNQDKNLGDNRRTSPGSLYKSFGVENSFQLGNGGSPKNEKDSLMVNIYQTIIEAHLKGRLKNSGFDNTYIGATENVYRCLFARYLSERKTKLLFVPKDFMTYFCFKHNHDGTGRSQIEDIKFILSLKITLMICRMMAAMNSSIDRKNINVNFTEEMGDPIQYIEMLKKEAIDKSVVNFTYDPTEVSRTLAQKAISVRAKGIPGAENFEVTTEPNEYRSIKPDESLMEDINNMMVVGLDIPPSAMNLLAENEFSRSVATNNLFFSRKISAKQKIVCKETTRYIQIYVSMSQQLKDEIKGVLNQGKKEGGTEPSKNDGTVDDKTSSRIDDLICDIIKNIETSLPAPDVAPNKTEFEELDAMISSITTALEALFDNDLASDDPIPAMRALIKSDIIRDYMKKIGVTNDAAIPDFNTNFLQRLTDFRHKFVNMKKAVADITKNTTSVPDDGSVTDPSNTGGDTSF